MTDISPLIAFSAGIVSVLSPCVLPLIPAVMTYSTGKGRLRPLAIVIGLSMAFTSMGIVASALVWHSSVMHNTCEWLLLS